MADSSTTGRNLILAGVVLGLGAAAAGFYVSSSYDKPVIDTSVRGNGDVPAMMKKVQAVYDAATHDVMLTDLAPEGAVIKREKIQGADGKFVKVPSSSEEMPIYAPIFMAPKLWIVRDPSSDSTQVRICDLYAPDAKAPKSRVHAGVPNEWFFRYGLDSVICDSNALAQDSDGDGFTNEEEFKNNTDPTDPAVYPALVTDSEAKMTLVKRHEESHVLELSPVSDFFAADGPVMLINIYKGKDKATAPRIAQAKDKKVGDSFGFSDAVDNSPLSANRFKIVSAGKGAEGNHVVIEDTYSKKEGDKSYTISQGKAKAVVITDISAKFRMTAGSAKGKEIEHAIQEGEVFDIPGFDGTKGTLVSSSKGEAVVKIGGENVKIRRETPNPKEKK